MLVEVGQGGGVVHGGREPTRGCPARSAPPPSLAAAGTQSNEARRRGADRTMRQRLSARRLLGAVAALLTLVLPACTGDRPADAASAATAAATVGNRYTAVGPVRLADTRSRFGTSPPGRVPGNGTVVVQVTGRPEVAIPAGASAVVLGVVSVEAAGSSFTTVWPSDQPRPLASNLNVDHAGAVVANMVTTRLSTDGRVSLYTNVAADLVVDVYGYYAPVAGAVTAGRTVAVTPTRAYDSRSSGGTAGLGRVPHRSACPRAWCRPTPSPPCSTSPSPRPERPATGRSSRPARSARAGDRSPRTPTPPARARPWPCKPSCPSEPTAPSRCSPRPAAMPSSTCSAT